MYAAGTSTCTRSSSCAARQSTETLLGTPASASASDRASWKSRKTGGCPLLVVSDACTDPNASLHRPMPVRRLRDDEQLDVARGGAVVVIPVYGAVGDF